MTSDEKGLAKQTIVNMIDKNIDINKINNVNDRIEVDDIISSIISFLHTARNELHSIIEKRVERVRQGHKDYCGGIKL